MEVPSFPRKRSARVCSGEFHHLPKAPNAEGDTPRVQRTSSAGTSGNQLALADHPQAAEPQSVGPPS
jgi:hypothetical protein